MVAVKESEYSVKGFPLKGTPEVNDDGYKANDDMDEIYLRKSHWQRLEEIPK